jgi:biopolymer transport protein TolQ
MEKTFSLINLIHQADVIVQAVILLLVIASIWSFAIIFDKIIKFKVLKNRSEYFKHCFETMSIDELFEFAKKNDNHPMSRVFISGTNELKSLNGKQIAALTVDKKENFQKRIIVTMEISLTKSLEKLESGLDLLAIIGSITPFVGLFGTVFGIMNSFQGIAASKNTSLAVVAPGIAEALLATGIGLFVAIPAVFFYNVFSSKINKFTTQLEAFTKQLAIDFFQDEFLK